MSSTTHALPCCVVDRSLPSGFALRFVLAGLTPVAYGEIQEAVNSPLPDAYFWKRESGSQPFHRILPMYASLPIDLIVNANAQDSTQTSQRTKGSRGDHQHIVVQLFSATQELSQNEHTRIHRMLVETQLLGEELLKRPYPPLTSKSWSGCKPSVTYDFGMVRQRVFLAFPPSLCAGSRFAAAEW